jgi:hypothetical protein
LQKGPLKKIKDLQVLPIVMKIITVGKAWLQWLTMSHSGLISSEHREKNSRCTSLGNLNAMVLREKDLLISPAWGRIWVKCSLDLESNPDLPVWSCPSMLHSWTKITCYFARLHWICIPPVLCSDF